MTLESLLFLLSLRRDILVSDSEIWWSSHGPDRRMQRALRKHRRGLALLLGWSSIDTCPARDLHRRYWRYAGAGQFVCDACEQCERSVA